MVTTFSDFRIRNSALDESEACVNLTGVIY